MSPSRSWKLFFSLAILGTGLMTAVWLYRDAEKPETTSQWTMPEAAPPVSDNVKDPFPQPKKVLNPEEIRTGKWGPETTPPAAKNETPGTVDKQDL